MVETVSGGGGLLQGLMMILLFAKKINDGNQFCSVLFYSVHLLRHANVLFVLQLLSDTGSHKDSIRPGHSNLKDFSTTTIYLVHLNFTLTFYFVGRSLPIFFFFLIHIYCSCVFFYFRCCMFSYSFLLPTGTNYYGILNQLPEHKGRFKS